MLAAENIQRQITVAVVVAVKEASFLAAMQRRVGRVQVEHDALRRPRVRFDEQRRQQLIERFLPAGDLLVAVGLRG